MKRLCFFVCIICFALPTISLADDLCLPCEEKMFEEGSLAAEQLQSIVSGEWNETATTEFLADNELITPAYNLNSYLCLYLGYEALMQAMDCIIYFGYNYYYSYYCQAAVGYYLAYSYFCS